MSDPQNAPVAAQRANRGKLTWGVSLERLEETDGRLNDRDCLFDSSLGGDAQRLQQHRYQSSPHEGGALTG
jgi:hypothetical protein